MDSELQVKYQKLGQEYQKLRAQVSVLKKGVIDEQANNKLLQEALKQKDQIVRKHEQEIDSLQFRNDQLSKRVEILQGDLDVWERGTNRPKSSVDYMPNEIDHRVHEQELEMKIKENEILHEQLHEVSQQHQIIVQKLEAKLELLENKTRNHDKTVEETNARYNRIIERMQEDRTALENKISKHEEELKIANIMIDKYQKQIKGSQNDVKSKLDKATKILKEKIPFDDSERAELNMLNVPVCDRNHQIQSKNIVDNFTSIFIEFMASLSDFHTYLEQRINIFGTDMMQEQLGPVNSKLCLYLRENAHINRSTQHAMKEFNDSLKSECFISLRTCHGLKPLSEKFTKMSKYLDKLSPYQVLSIQEECSWAGSNEDIEKENKHLIKYSKQLTATISRLQRSVSLLASIGEGSTHVSNSSPCILLIRKQLEVLLSICQGMCKSYNSKMIAEEELPMLTDRLKNTEQCIVSSLSGMTSVASKFVKFFQENIAFITADSGFKRKGVTVDEGSSTAVKIFHSQAAQYMQSLRKDPAITVPYEIAVKNKRTLMKSTESRDTLAEEVAHSRETRIKLEQEKQHWLLEAELLKAKYEKEVKKVASLGDELGKLKTEYINTRHSSESIDDVLQRDKFTNISTSSTSSFIRKGSSSSNATEPLPQIPQPIGVLEFVSEDRDVCDADRDHEELVKTHLTSRINELTKQLQMSDSKTVTHYAECRALYKQLVLADKSKKKIAKELVQAKTTIGGLEDELETTKRSYEDQIKMLSDHLCGMNDKLSSQKDEIDLLKTTTPGKTTSKLGFGRKKQ